MLLSRTAITMHQHPLFMANLLPEPYQGRIRTVLAPYHLQPEVPLDGEDTEKIRGKYGSGTLQVQFRQERDDVRSNGNQLCKTRQMTARITSFLLM